MKSLKVCFRLSNLMRIEQSRFSVHFLFFIVCFPLLVSSAHAQSLDSMYTIWQDRAQPDSIRVTAYENYIEAGFLYVNPDSALILAEELHRFAEKHQYQKAKASAYFLQGGSHYVKGDYELALEYDNKSLELKEKIGDRSGMARSYNNIASIYVSIGEYTEALNYFEKGLAICTELDINEGVANIFGNMGVIYNLKGNYPRALDAFEKSLEVWEKIGDKEGIASNLSNIGTLHRYHGDLEPALINIEKAMVLFEETGDIRSVAMCLKNIGVILMDQGEAERALEKFDRALQVFEEVGDKSGIAFCLINKSALHRVSGEYSESMKLARKALSIHEEIGDKIGISNDRTIIGNIYQRLGNFAEALNNCRTALNLAEEISALKQQEEACACLHNAYMSLDNSGEALKYYKRMISHRDSLFNTENTKKLTRIEMQYSFDKQEAKTRAEQEKKDAVTMQEMKRQRLMRNGFMSGFTVVLLFAGIFFTQRNKISKEKARSEELLLNILPGEVAEELKSKGEAEAQLIDHVTVLFTDFKGFTSLAEKVTPKELVHDLHRCFSAFDHICEKYGIEKIKTIGDAYMAAGGLPLPNDTHARDVVHAALEMARFVEKGKLEKQSEGAEFFEVRIGIHTGPVVAGIVGVKKFQYDIWGDTVNTASRMESSGDVGMVNISETTYGLLKDDPEFTFESRGKIAAKGKGEVEMYFVSAKS